MTDTPGTRRFYSHFETRTFFFELDSEDGSCARQGAIGNAGFLAYKDCGDNVVRAYGGINDAQHALEWLAKAYREHNADLIDLVREPSFASLHSNANFRELVRRVGWERLPTAG